MSSTGRDRTAAVLGSVADDVLRAMLGPIIVVGPHVDQFESFAGDIVVPVDGSDFSETSLPLAASWGIAFGGTPWIVEVLTEPVPAGVDVFESSYPNRLAHDLQAQSHHDVEFDVLHGPSAAKAITDYALHNKASLIVMSTHGRTGLSRLSLGSTAAAVVQGRRLPGRAAPATTLRPGLNTLNPGRDHGGPVRRRRQSFGLGRCCMPSHAPLRPVDTLEPATADRHWRDTDERRFRTVLPRGHTQLDGLDGVVVIGDLIGDAADHHAPGDAAGRVVAVHFERHTIVGPDGVELGALGGSEDERGVIDERVDGVDVGPVVGADGEASVFLGAHQFPALPHREHRTVTGASGRVHHGLMLPPARAGRQGRVSSTSTSAACELTNDPGPRGHGFGR